jgi:single-stranded-DNA-specific exonuclease
MSLFEEVLKARGITGEVRELFLAPVYDGWHDPFLLPDMQVAIDRLVVARERQEHVAIYGDYDIDGLSATALLLDAFDSFGFKHVVPFIPNRFSEGYGLTREAVEKLAHEGAKLIVTVDTGSLSHKEVARANELGVDVIVTDHHNVAETPPPAVATVNPKRPESRYPFTDLAAVGVAFKLVQALQTRLDGLPNGQEKWLLDLVALGTVCDIVTLLDENRVNVYWGLKVMANTRRPGLKALMALAGTMPEKVTARTLGFGLGPRMNAAGRLETAQYALDMLRADDPKTALEKAQKLDDLNAIRRSDQDKIYKAAMLQAEMFAADPVLVVSDPQWSHGIIGIVAAKLLEKYKKPTYVLQELGEESKGSARSYGDFSAADAIRAADDLITKGGGHKLAAGVTLPTKNIPAFRQRVNEFYRSQKLFNQPALLLPKADVTVSSLADVNEGLLNELALMEPFGNGNPEAVFKGENLLVVNQRRMGSEAQHIKLELKDDGGNSMRFLAFNAPEHFLVEPGERVTVWFQPTLNEWNGRSSVEGRLLHLETDDI